MNIFFKNKAIAIYLHSTTAQYGIICKYNISYIIKKTNLKN